jgi:hypothetical protein
MPETDKPAAKNLEMRVAELEDKLRAMHVTEDEMKAFQKVSALMGGGSAAAVTASPALTPANCVISQCTVSQCTVVAQCIRQCTVVSQCVRQCTIVSQCVRQCIVDCINECGGGLPGGPLVGGGFGTLGG